MERIERQNKVYAINVVMEEHYFAEGKKITELAKKEEFLNERSEFDWES